MRAWKQWGLLSSEDLFKFLVTRATERTLDLGHVVSPWTTAKRRMGKGAKRAMCTKCGKGVFVLPYGQHGLLPKVSREAPTITGEALVKRCTN